MDATILKLLAKLFYVMAKFAGYRGQSGIGNLRVTTWPQLQLVVPC